MARSVKFRLESDPLKGTHEYIKLRHSYNFKCISQSLSRALSEAEAQLL